ncbi:MAG: ankyrin repeat domain-containing protein [Alphaproteobacteria bacterium]
MNLGGLFDKVTKKISAEERDRLSQDLHTAAGNGDLEAVRECHEKGADINYKYDNLGTALIAAASDNHLPVVDYLLTMKADVTLTNMFNQTALHISIRQGADNALSLKLIDAAAPVNGRDTHGATPSFYAAQNANAEALEALAQKCADFTLANKHDVTPLMQATMASHAEAIDVLTKYKCGLDQQDEDGRTALMHAVIGRNAALVKKYLSLGANFDTWDKNGDTALALAKQSPGRKEIVDILEQAATERLRPFHSGTDGSVTIMKRLVLKGASA